MDDESVVLDRPQSAADKKTEMEPGIRRGVSYSKDPAVVAQELYSAIAQTDIELCIVYCSPNYDFEVLGRELNKCFGDLSIIGCTTAGEITPEGFLNDSVTAISLAAPDFRAVTRCIEDLENFELSAGVETSRDMLNELINRGVAPLKSNTFGLLLIDGLSMREEVVVSSIHSGLGDINLFGASAGDNMKFEQTFLYHDGEFRSNCATFTLIQTNRQFTVFKNQHYVETETKIVVTGADPVKRLVTEINGLPAAEEYANSVGVTLAELTPGILALHPVIVKIGGEFYVRSIQQVNDDGSLLFYCAIDEGIVLTLAKGVDFMNNLEGMFEGVREKVGELSLVLGSDCCMRQLEFDDKGLRDRVTDVLKRNNVFGFSTYGEQINSMHVNQTFTGVAIGARK